MALSIDLSSDRPAYRQIADHLRSSIQSGEIAPGSPIPSEQELCDRYNAARGTVRQAIGLLRNEGLVLSERGRGTFARERPPVRRLAQDRFARRHRQAGKAAFIAEAEAAGRTPEVEVLQVEPVDTPPDIAKRLGVRTSSRVLIRRRRYLVDGHPVELASSYLPWSLVKGSQIAEVDPGPGGIYARLEDMGHKLKHFSEEVTSRMPTPEEAKALRLASGIPIFHLVRTAYGTDEKPLEVCDTIMAADAYVLAYDLPAR
jgi:GntR family transcriptional regulator